MIGVVLDLYLFFHFHVQKENTWQNSSMYIFQYFCCAAQLVNHVIRWNFYCRPHHCCNKENESHITLVFCCILEQSLEYSVSIRMSLISHILTWSLDSHLNVNDVVCNKIAALHLIFMESIKAIDQGQEMWTFIINVYGMLTRTQKDCGIFSVLNASICKA